MVYNADVRAYNPRTLVVAAFRVQDFEVLEAKRSGKYETGIVRPTCGDIRLKHSEVGIAAAGVAFQH